MEERKHVRDGDFVLPGDYLGVIEEYLPGEGVVEDNGELYATRAGRVKVNMERMEISVEPATDTPPIPRRGDIVLAEVIDVKPQAVVLNIVKIEGRNNLRGIATSTLASLHVSHVGEGYVENLSNEFKIGDIVRARVTGTEKSPLQLTTKGPTLGVVYALCSSCRTPLIRRGNQLVCPNCGSVETRKLSSLYRRIKV